MTSPACTTEAQPGPVEVWVAPQGSRPYTWVVEVTFFDPSKPRGTPLDLTGKVPWADLYTGPGTVARRIPLTSVVSTRGRGLLVVSSTITSTVTPGNPSDTTFPVRALLGYTDTAGEDLPLGPLYFLPLDPSSAQVLA